MLHTSGCTHTHHPNYIILSPKMAVSGWKCSSVGKLFASYAQSPGLPRLHPGVVALSYSPTKRRRWWLRRPCHHWLLVIAPADQSFSSILSP